MKIVVGYLFVLIPLVSLGRTDPNPWEGLIGCYETITVNGLPLESAVDIPGNVYSWGMRMATFCQENLRVCETLTESLFQA